jgi:penicillin-binding protein 1A
VYTAAVEAGVKPEDIVVDGPVSFGGYTPHNYENNYKGAMTVLNAFAESRNIPALKLADRVGIHKVIEVAHRFGVTTNIPAYLPVALGAVEITLEEQVASYSVFPNDGIRVTPRLVRKVSNSDGITLWGQPPTVKDVTSQETARTMMRLLREVTRSGTGAAAAQLNHPVGGKTGTTSDYTDAWFMGFSPSVTCGVWVGFDSRQSLGDKETGAKAALPIWMTFMKEAIQGKDDERFASDVGTGPVVAKVAAPDAGAGKAAVAAGPAAGVKAAAPAVAKPVTPSGVKPAVKAGAPVAGKPGGAAPSAPQKTVTPAKPAATGNSPGKGVVKPALPVAVAGTKIAKPVIRPALPQ